MLGASQAGSSSSSSFSQASGYAQFVHGEGYEQRGREGEGEGGADCSLIDASESNHR